MEPNRKPNTKCVICGNGMYRRPYQLAEGKGKYCSRACRNTAHPLPDGRNFPSPKFGVENPAWKGGVTYKRKKGNYVGPRYVRCPEKWKCMARSDGYIMEHRLVMAEWIGRPLLRSEVVNHINRNPRDNRRENLELYPSNGDHKRGGGRAFCAGCRKPASPSGLGTALKPAIEPIILARKPLDGTVAANVLAHGVGGLNIDASRVGTDVTITKRPVAKSNGKVYGRFNRGEDSENPAGRFPANVLLDEHAAEEMDEQSGVSTSQGGTGHSGAFRSDGAIYGAGDTARQAVKAFGDTGGASRFFPVFKYQAKAPKRERPVIYKNNCECEEWQSQQKATTESTETEKQSWNTSTSGSSTTAQYQTDMISTISTTTNSTTESKTSPASAKSSISESTQDARSETENGGSHANSAEVSNQSLKITGTSVKKAGHNTDGVGHATSAKWYTTSECEKCGEPRRKVQHVTVKPLALMSWLVTLITPEGGTTLDPFAGTGTTLQAARDKGFAAIGVEQDEDYIALIEQRLSA